LKPVNQSVAPFWRKSAARSSRVTCPSCQVMFVARISVIVRSIPFKISWKSSQVHSLTLSHFYFLILNSKLSILRLRPQTQDTSLGVGLVEDQGRGRHAGCGVAGFVANVHAYVDFAGDLARR